MYPYLGRRTNFPMLSLTLKIELPALSPGLGKANLDFGISSYKVGLGKQVSLVTDRSWCSHTGKQQQKKRTSGKLRSFIALCVLWRRIIHKKKTARAKNYSKSFSAKCKFSSEKQGCSWQYDSLLPPGPIFKSYMWKTILSLNLQTGIVF